MEFFFEKILCIFSRFIHSDYHKKYVRYIEIDVYSMSVVCKVLKKKTFFNYFPVRAGFLSF